MWLYYYHLDTTIGHALLSFMALVSVQKVSSPSTNSLFECGLIWPYMGINGDVFKLVMLEIKSFPKSKLS